MKPSLASQRWHSRPSCELLGRGAPDDKSRDMRLARMELLALGGSDVLPLEALTGDSGSCASGAMAATFFTRCEPPFLPTVPSLNGFCA